MNIGILGTGTVGRAFGVRLVELGHAVKLGSRDVGRLLARTEPDEQGRPPFGVWHKQYPAVRVGNFAEAAAHGELLFNATNGIGSLAALQQAGEANLSGKVLVDLANPLDSSHGMPPVLSVANTDSLGEQIQRAFPSLRVVKALNTMNVNVMLHPDQLAGGDHTVFVCGNDAAAKAQVTRLLTAWFGWRDVIDLGDITSARGTEMLLPVWLRLWGTLKTGQFNLKVVR